MGFNNAGAAVAAERLQRRADQIRRARQARRARWARRTGRTRGGSPPVAVGVNIGKTKAVPAEKAIADYVASARLVAGVAGYVVVNVSSPNTPGLRNLQAVVAAAAAAPAGHRRPGALGTADRARPGRRVPLLVKIAPDLADGDMDAIADLAVELGLDGIIATNTTTARPGLATDPAEVAAAGPGGCPARR